MKIAFCLESSFNSGGMERMLSVIANAISQYHTITVITAFNENKPDFFIFEKSIIRIDLGIKREMSHCSSQIKAIYRNKLENYLLRNRQDITISLGSLEFYFLTKLDDGSKKIFWFHFALNYDIATCTTTPFEGINAIIGRIKQKRRILTAKRYDKIICLSKSDLRIWRKYLSNVIQIYNPITIKKIAEPNYATKRAIAVGRLDKQKGFDLLISAWEEVYKKFPDWKLDIYGEGTLREMLQNQINKCNLKNTITLQGHSHNIAQEYSNHSVMILSSRYEGFPLVLCESSACAIPMISFNCESGPIEIIKNHHNGIIVSPTGDVNNLATAICEMLESQSKRQQYGNNAFISSPKFGLENITVQWLNLFNSLSK